jgi:hypothetical protein
MMNREAAAYWIPAFAGMTSSCGAASCVIASARFLTLPWRGRVDAKRRGGVIPQIGHCSRGGTFTPPRLTFRCAHVSLPSPSRGG